MGLDIYLKKYENFEETIRKEEEFRDFEEKLWMGVDYNSLNESEKEEFKEKERLFSFSLGLDEYGQDEVNKKSVTIDHPKYPEHYFKIGYFRSSYNDSGIEKILRNMDLPTMGDIFNPKGEYIFQPDWEECLAKINKLIEDFSHKGDFRVFCVDQNIFREPDINSSKDALSVFIKEMERSKEGGPESYSNINGEFHFEEPLEVLALIPGNNNSLGKKRPCTYVVTKSSNKWYSEALEIIRDTVEFVLKQEDKQKYFLHWSG